MDKGRGEWKEAIEDTVERTDGMKPALYERSISVWMVREHARDSRESRMIVNGFVWLGLEELPALAGPLPGLLGVVKMMILVRECCRVP